MNQQSAASIQPIRSCIAVPLSFVADHYTSQAWNYRRAAETLRSFAMIEPNYRLSAHGTDQRVVPDSAGA